MGNTGEYGEVGGGGTGVGAELCGDDVCGGDVCGVLGYFDVFAWGGLWVFDVGLFSFSFLPSFLY